MKVGQWYSINGHRWKLTGARFPKCGPLFDFSDGTQELSLTRRELALNRIDLWQGN